jgi:hypothetical protein
MMPVRTKVDLTSSQDEVATQMTDILEVAFAKVSPDAGGPDLLKMFKVKEVRDASSAPNLTSKGLKNPAFGTPTMTPRVARSKNTSVTLTPSKRPRRSIVDDE